MSSWAWALAILQYQHLVPILTTYAIIRLVDWIIKRRRFIEAINKLPGLPLKDLHFFYGHVDTLLATRGQIPGRPTVPMAIPWFLERIPEYAVKHGILRLWFFNPYRVPFARSSISILDPDLFQQMLIKHGKSLIKAKRIYKIAAPILGNSFLTLPDGSAWKRQRKMTALAFHQDLIQNVCTTVYELLEKQVFPVVDMKPQIEAMEWSARLTTEVLGLVAFSHSFGSYDDHHHSPPVGDIGTVLSPVEGEYDESLYTIFTTILTTISLRLLSPPLLNLLRIQQNQQFRRACNKLDSVIGGIVKDRLAKEIEAADSSPGKPNAKNKRGGNDILANLLLCDDDGKRLSYQAIFDNVRMFLFAGHDTTAASVAWAFWELAVHPEVQERLQVEVDSLFNARDDSDGNDGDDSSNNVLDYNRIAQLKYLDAVMKETLRLHSPAPVARTSLDDICLERADETFFIPAGSNIYAIPLYMHGFAKGPVGFCPERFLNETDEESSSSAAMMRVAYFPFSIGPRNCVGQPMAVAEIKTILCHVLRRYTIRPSANAVTPIPVLMLTVKPHQVLVDLEPRTGTS
jgi:cytochrome P450